MQSKLLHEADGKRTFAVILQKGDEAMRCLQDFAVKEGLGGLAGDCDRRVEQRQACVFRLGDEAISAHSRRGAGRSRVPRGRYRGGAGRQTKHPCACSIRTARWDRSGRAPAGRSRQAHARDHHHGISGASLQGERPGERAGADQRTQVVKLLPADQQHPSPWCKLASTFSRL